MKNKNQPMELYKECFGPGKRMSSDNSVAFEKQKGLKFDRFQFTTTILIMKC